MLTESLTQFTTHRAAATCSYSPRHLQRCWSISSPVLHASACGPYSGSIGDVLARWKLAVLHNNLRGQCL